MNLKELSAQIRIRALITANKAGIGHPGGDLSCADVLAVLFSKFLYQSKLGIKDPDRHRFILSKGHAALSYYSALVLTGIIQQEDLETFCQEYSLFSGHPASEKIEAVETSTGPLGHGLPIGVGMALAAKLQQSDRKAVILCGDGEMQEGSNWEAAMLAGHHQLGNLMCIVDRNLLQHGKRTEEVVSLFNIENMFSAFGWEVISIDGNCTDQIERVVSKFSKNKYQKPFCVIANTVKGKGVSFMEGKAQWHHKIPTDEELALAIHEISNNLNS